MILPDSGERRQFDSGAVRDIAQGKGRCDLMPLGVIGEWLGHDCLVYIDEYLYTGNLSSLYKTLITFMDYRDMDPYSSLLEVAKHFEDGAIKYGDRNWEKGIPVHCYIDSAVRHYLKYRRGDEDEPHDRAFMWNILCAMWTHEKYPELIDIPAGKEVSDEEVTPHSPTLEEMREFVFDFCALHNCDNCPCVPDERGNCYRCERLSDLERNYKIVKEHNANECNSGTSDT